MANTEETSYQTQSLSYQDRIWKGNQEEKKEEDNLSLYEKTDLRIVSNITPLEMDYALTGTKLEGLGQVYIFFGKQEKVNAIFLAAISILESKGGSSAAAITKNNLFGIMAYNDDKYTLKRYSSKEQSISHAARIISCHYLNKNGKHHNGFTVRDIGLKYAEDPEWSNKVIKIIDTILEKTIEYRLNNTELNKG